ncbi:MAG: DUF362 domain-containing protein [Candidatus Brocadiaceae bacterium]
MRIIKSPLFYYVGISIFLFLKLQWRYVFKFLFRQPDAKKINHKPAHNNVYKEANKTLVSIVRGDDVYTMLREGIELVGGLEKLDVKGKSVLIKPNIVNRYPSPANTSPVIIKNLIKILHESGVSKVLVGDMSAIFVLPTKRNAIRSGVWEVIKDEDMEFLAFEDCGWVEVDIPQGRFVKKAIVSEILYNVDRIINVPVIKTHSYAHYTISLKNFIGAIHPQQRPYFIAPEYWDEIVAELNLAYTPHLNILDGTKIFTKKGPTRGTVAQPNLIVITGDRIAADVVGLSIINAFGGDVEVWEQRQVKRAVELNLGMKSYSELKIVSKCLDTRAGFEEIIQKIHYHLSS